jgi:hypothetical protein
MTYSDAFRLLEMFTERDYAGRPHLYVHSRKADSWVRPKGMRIISSREQVAIQDWETEEWEALPLNELEFGLW